MFEIVNVFTDASISFFINTNTNTDTNTNTNYSPSMAHTLEETRAQLRSMWSKVPLSTVLKAHWKTEGHGHQHKDVVAVPSNVPVETAFDMLVSAGISAAPVHDPSNNTYIGMVSMHDVLEYVIALVQANKQVLQDLDRRPLDDVSEVTSDKPTTTAESDNSSNAAASMNDYPPALSSSASRLSGDASPADADETRGLAIAEVVRRVRQVRAVPVSYISDISSRDPFHSLPLSASLLTALEIFTKGIHRIVITDPAQPNVLVGILTQSDILHYINEHEKDEQLAEALKIRVSDYGLSEHKDIVQVKAFQHVIDALQAIHANRLSSVAVVDGSSRLLGNISATDVKHIMRHLRYGVLFDTCSQFINKVKTRQMLENAGKDIVPVIQVNAHAVLQQVVRLMMVTRVHRVWVTEQNPANANFQSPLSVISMTDILRVLV